MKKFKILVQEKVMEHQNLLKKRIIYPDESVNTLNENFPNSKESIGNLPLNYYEDFLAPTQKCFLQLKANIEGERERILKDMASRVQKHFKWIDPATVKNRVVWNALRNYLLDQEVLRRSEFGSEEFEVFVRLFFDETSRAELIGRESASVMARRVNLGKELQDALRQFGVRKGDVLFEGRAGDDSSTEKELHRVH